jgi:CheY-like chemotaxis protein
MAIRALVCDDDAPIRQMVREMLEGRAVEVLEAKNGFEGLAIFRKERIDLLVTDFLMPRMDGMQVVRSVRMSGERGQIPIVLMSAISKSHIFRSKEEEPDHYISKPFKLKKMAKLLDKVLSRIQDG